MAFLKVCDLYKNFGSTQVLSGVSFEMEKGEVVSIIGSSGNGKTTLLRCLNFLEIPDGGEIYVDGNLIFPFPQKEKENAQQKWKAGKKRKKGTHEKDAHLWFGVSKL
jgi:polar amino acid transport system ATP-binding protein